MRDAIAIAVLGLLVSVLPSCGGSDAAPVLQVQARSSGREIQVAVKLLDEGGRVVRALKLPDGKKTGSPTVVFLDAEGEELDRQRLSYG